MKIYFQNIIESSIKGSELEEPISNIIILTGKLDRELVEMTGATDIREHSGSTSTLDILRKISELLSRINMISEVYGRLIDKNLKSKLRK
jgi:hypothetical protein